ncbi:MULTISPECIES: ABC transporter substrate-binding protein [unclassified Paraburkholderia]|uniref:ABC transporter substrate-binding protein n=1 Tax=unclassified Paraburkholderia TaxID=2615204 RepID=UPI00161B1759|nr:MULTISPECIES: ABC transporter substrate-binding protein [unclassified Paraburkholderia]MBB5448094.1 NitT/TauT family transport system substrate-binding protein [Paraburkholderia sp. WSM4177]MBB5488540.1 NitT/TauT family transport system substrate-binding protein [Paraburkholderia sp. WSM4180]
MKKIALTLVAACLVGGQASAAEPATAAAGAAPQRIVLLVDEIKAIRNFPVVLAERLGYLNDGKMAVTVMNIRDDVSTADMLNDGRVDAVVAYYHHNVVNQAHGIDTQAVVTLGVTPGAKVLVANQAREKYQSVTDLKGARFIAGGAGSSKSTVANALMLAGGHGIGDYARLGTDGKEKNIDALRDGSADFVVAPTPDGDLYESKGVATVFADLTSVDGTRRSLGTLFPSSTVYMSGARVRAHPEIARHLAGAFVRTLQYINSHSPEQLLAVIPPEISGKDRVAYLKVLKEEIPMFANDGRMPDDGATKEWQVLAAANPAYGSVKVDRTYTNAFVDEALRTLH